MPLTDARAGELAKMVEGATPGPWTAFRIIQGYSWYIGSDARGGCTHAKLEGENREADSALIVAAVNALPGLLAERAALVEALESEKKNASALYGEIEDLRAEFERATDRLHVRLAAAEVALSSFEVKPPDGDGDVWMTMKHSAGSAMLNLGKAERITAQVGQLLEEDRRAALVGGQADEPV